MSQAIWHYFLATPTETLKLRSIHPHLSLGQYQSHRTRKLVTWVTVCLLFNHAQVCHLEIKQDFSGADLKSYETNGYHRFNKKTHDQFIITRTQISFWKYKGESVITYTFNILEQQQSTELRYIL